MNFCILLKRVLAKSELYEHIVLAASIAIVAKRSLKIIKLIGYLLVKKKKKICKTVLSRTQLNFSRSFSHSHSASCITVRSASNRFVISKSNLAK